MPGVYLATRWIHKSRSALRAAAAVDRSRRGGMPACAIREGQMGGGGRRLFHVPRLAEVARAPRRFCGRRCEVERMPKVVARLGYPAHLAVRRDAPVALRRGGAGARGRSAARARRKSVVLRKG
eukprot:1411604-Prymnesium_polylepis.1